MMQVGRKIKEFRQKAGLKQADLANILGISPQAISRWENGESAPDIMFIPDIAHCLNISIDALFGYYPKENQTIHATVMVTNICNFTDDRLKVDLKDLFNILNSHYHKITETILKYKGIPTKYFGNEVLCFFAGDDHEKRAIEAAFNIINVSKEKMSFGISSGNIYMGKIGHSDYASLDIIGESVAQAYKINMHLKNTHGNGVGIADNAMIKDSDNYNYELITDTKIKYYKIIKIK
jgi:transcriptional regulator with XRE-family HTH domain